MEDGALRKSPGLIEAIGRFLRGRKRVTEEEIQELMDAGEEEGLINEEENEMIRAIFALRDTVVREIMVPRTDMASLTVDAPIDEVLQTIIACGHSRIPIFEGTIDNVIGILYAKDLLKCWGQHESELVVRRLMRAPFFTPETKNLEELLQEFKKRRVHLAIVIDEYGGTSGLVTIEDLLEQIVGDIQDEYDIEEEWLTEEEDGTVTVDARLPIEELEGYFGVTVEREKFDTVGGLIFYLLGRIPGIGEEVACNGLLLTVLDADERRIIKVRVNRRSVAEEATPAS